MLSGGVASAATGTLPDPAQDVASTAVSHVGLHIPKSDKKEHPENHGKDVSTVAHDPANKGADHGAAVCAVASRGKCKAGEDHATTTTTVAGTEDTHGKSADHRQDGDHHATTDDNDSVEPPDDSTTTDVNDDAADAADHESKDKSSEQDHPSADDHPSAGDHHNGSDD
jgi:hypothetical protein